MGLLAIYVLSDRGLPCHVFSSHFSGVVMARHSVGKRGSASQFRGRASKTHKVNVRTHLRGGIRL